MEEKKEQMSGLPENAYRELKEGEEYQPMMRPDKTYREVTPWSVGWGLVMAVVFSAAAAFLGLKVGQVFEAAIPIAIIAVGLSSGFKRKNALGENVIIQSIGASSGVIVAGAIFTLPALYILQDKYPEITVNFFEVFMSSLLGGILGILLLIPFRKYFVSTMHGKYPFPEATATTQVLVSGEKGGNQAKPLIFAGLIGGLYDFIVATFGGWSETVSTTIVSAGATLAEKVKLVMKVNTGAAVLGLGYIIGLKYSLIICAGSFLVWLIIIPVMSAVFSTDVLTLGNDAITATVGSMSAEEIFTTYARHIGIGGIATAGVIGIIKSWGIIKGAVGLAVKEMNNKGEANMERLPRTQRDIPMKIISMGVVGTLIVTAFFFQFGLLDNPFYAFIGLLLVAVIAFLFTTVAANAIAIVGTNPVSGMTLMTLILASIILVACGLKGTAGMVSALIIGGVVCTALSMAGGFITDLKIGSESDLRIYQRTVGSSASQCHGSRNRTVDEWSRCTLGLNFMGVPALAFALGMFIPLELNTPLLIGGAINWYVGSRSKDQALNNARLEKGTLLSSGFIAGGALMGVVSAALRFAGVDLYQADWAGSKGAEVLAIVMYLALMAYLTYSSLRAKKETNS